MAILAPNLDLGLLEPSGNYNLAVKLPFWLQIWTGGLGRPFGKDNLAVKWPCAAILKLFQLFSSFLQYFKAFPNLFEGP